MSTLFLLRHAKSDWSTGAPDHGRPLNARGRRDAYAAGRLLAERGWRPDLALCSSAKRTRQTWARAVEGGADAGEVLIEPRIYEASVTTLLALVRQVPASVGSLMLIGHGPGLPGLAEQLGGVEDKYPTSALAVIEIDQPWADVDRGRLLAYEVPRG